MTAITTKEIKILYYYKQALNQKLSTDPKEENSTIAFVKEQDKKPSQSEINVFYQYLYTNQEYFCVQVQEKIKTKKNCSDLTAFVIPFLQLNPGAVPISLNLADQNLAQVDFSNLAFHGANFTNSIFPNDIDNFQSTIFNNCNMTGIQNKKMTTEDILNALCTNQIQLHRSYANISATESVQYNFKEKKRSYKIPIIQTTLLNIKSYWTANNIKVKLETVSNSWCWWFFFTSVSYDNEAEQIITDKTEKIGTAQQKALNAHTAVLLNQ